MSNTIKSVTLKVGADTKDFIKGLKKADREINQTSKLANELNKGLKIDYDPKRAIQAQKQFQKALTQTEEKAEAIRKQLAYLEQTGGVNTEGYAKLQTELAKTETKALGLKKSLEEINDVNLDKVGKNFDDLGKNLDNAGKKTAVLSAAATGLLVGIKKLGETARTTGDDIATNAVKYDLSTKAIQQWEYVALQSDVSASALYKSAQKIRSAFGDQLTGTTTTATKALDALGLSFNDFDTNEAAFEAAIKALSGIEDKALQAAYANDIFGERFSAEVIPLLQTGEKAISGYINEFEQVGYLSDEQVQSLGELDNTLNMVNARYEQSKIQLGVALLPMYEQFYNILETAIIPAIEKLAEWFGNLDESGQNLILGLLFLIATLSPLLIVLGKLSTGVGAIIKLMASLKGATLATAAGFAALGGAIGLSLDIIGNWQQMTTVEKVLKSLGLAALAAAAAMAVFHASWSVGVAVGAITAGAVAAIAAITAAGKEIYPDEVGNAGLETQLKGTTEMPEFKVPELPQTSGGDSYQDNSKTEINITMQSTGDLDYDAEQLAEAVNRELLNKKLAYR